MKANNRPALTPEEVKELVKRIGPHIDERYDHTSAPEFPEGRQDVCAVKRTAENGSSYGFDTVHLVWKGDDGELCHKELINTRTTKDYLHIESVTAEGDEITVKLGSGGVISGNPWEAKMRIATG